MTGSGACVFCEFARREDAEVLLGDLPPAMRGLITGGLVRHPLLDWVRS
jgi:4-diphosphocytidyl-2C-methyl-D-erythritol kinase